MFSQACVKNSVHKGGGCTPLLWQAHPLWQTPPSGRQTPTGQTPPGQTSPAPLGRYPWPRAGTPRDTPRDGYCSGRYASYWNTFLFNIAYYKTGGNSWAAPDGWDTLHPELNLNLDDSTPYSLHDGAIHVTTGVC